MNRRPLVVFLALAACAPQPTADPGEEVAPPNRAARELPLRAAHVAGLGGTTFTTVQRLGAGALVGTDHGLYTIDAADAPLRWLGDRTFVGHGILATTSFGDELFVAAFDSAGREAIRRSDDGGQTWRDASKGVRFSGNGAATFAATATRLVFDNGDAAFGWDAATGRWTAIDTGTIQPDAVVFDGDRLIVDDPSHGLFVASHADFEPIPALQHAWGYRAFAFDGARPAVANFETIFLRDAGGAWHGAFTNATCGTVAASLFAAGDVVLAAGSTNLERSDDGVTWTDVLDVQTSSNQALAGDADRVFWIADTLRSSTDLGATWKESPADVGVADAIAVGAGHVYAVGEEVGLAAAPADRFRASSSDATDVAATDREFWFVDGGDVLHAPHGAKTFTSAPLPFPYDDVPLVFATRRHVFASLSGVLCGQTPLELVRYRDADATWETIGAGLPSTPDDCAHAVDFGLLQIESLSEAGGALFVKVTNSGTFRSVDDGDSWTRVVGVVNEVAACGDALVGVGVDGGIEVSHDGGRSFTSSTAVAGHVSAVASFDGRCVVGLDAFDGRATLLTSTDGATFEPRAFHAPVVALAADAATLAISSPTAGVYRVSALED